jgi:hypothetical protein
MRKRHKLLVCRVETSKSPGKGEVTLYKRSASHVFAKEETVLSSIKELFSVHSFDRLFKFVKSNMHFHSSLKGLVLALATASLSLAAPPTQNWQPSNQQGGNRLTQSFPTPSITRCYTEGVTKQTRKPTTKWSTWTTSCIQTSTITITVTTTPPVVSSTVTNTATTTTTAPATT